MKKVLILKGKGRLDGVISDEFNKRSEGTVLYTDHNYSNISFNVSNEKVEVLVNDKPIEEYSLIYFKNWFNYNPFAKSIVQYLQFKGIPFVDSIIKDLNIDDKLSQTIIFALNGLNVPKTIFKTSKKYRYSNLIEELGKPFVFKAIDAREGEYNYLIRNSEDFESYLELVANQKMMCQEFVPNSSDYRLFVIDNSVARIKKRTRSKDSNDHRNNTVLGATVEFVEEDSDSIRALKEVALKAKKLVRREILGVDLIISDKDKKIYILEANPSPAVRHDWSITKDMGEFFLKEITNAE